jgi:hypothetical protein
MKWKNEQRLGICSRFALHDQINAKHKRRENKGSPFVVFVFPPCLLIDQGARPANLLLIDEFMFQQTYINRYHDNTRISSFEYELLYC